MVAGRRQGGRQTCRNANANYYIEEADTMLDIRRIRALLMLVALVAAISSRPALGQEVVVFGGIDDIVTWFQAEDWWGEEQRGTQLQVPHALITGISDAWRTRAQNMTVQQKKEIFYRFMLPLVMHANEMVRDRRVKLHAARQQLADGNSLSTEDLEALRRLAPVLRIIDEEEAAQLGESNEELLGVVDEALYRLDVIPAGLALGQAAYESGYATSRFAMEGNALFGQWTYGGKGLKPEQQRKHLGDHRIASFDWPFDSVRGYFINLNTHPAYEEFRALRARLKAEGKPLTALVLADGLTSYSERGQEYIDSLKGIIRVNKLDIADDAVFREEPVRYVIGTQSAAAAEQLRGQIEEMRGSGELEEIIDRMQLE
jgi:Bax protein